MLLDSLSQTGVYKSGRYRRNESIIYDHYYPLSWYLKDDGDIKPTTESLRLLMWSIEGKEVCVP